jgi:alpha-ribazole phosphatase
MVTDLNPKITRFWLIRHGEPQVDIQGRCYGSLDIGLSLGGACQIESVAQYLRPVSLSAVYSSPRRRALESARLIATYHSLPVTSLEALSEINFGSFEGLSYGEIEHRYPHLYRQWMECPTEIEFPNGESFAAMHRRVSEAARILRHVHCGQSIAIVSHGGVNRILLADALEIPLVHIFRIGQRYAALNRIDYVAHETVVEMVNACCVDESSNGQNLL